ncbi:hypothetical protein RPMD05_7 [Rhodobacteraceae phage LS06-2018-MD05]|nr:hypothetical protein RPMD05_7 [Rhodobacteraceae phage LS06-2018-MD05]
MLSVVFFHNSFIFWFSPVFLSRVFLCFLTCK